MTRARGISALIALLAMALHAVAATASIAPSAGPTDQTLSLAEALSVSCFDPDGDSGAPEKSHHCLKCPVHCGGFAPNAAQTIATAYASARIARPRPAAAPSPCALHSGAPPRAPPAFV